MANARYDSYAANLWGAGTRVDWDADTMKLDLVDSADYTPNTATHDFHDDVTGAGIVATVTLSGITTTAGTLDCSDPTFTAVSGDQSELLVFWKDTGTPSTSPLAFKFDTFTSGMPVTPNGGDIIVTINASGIATI